MTIISVTINVYEIFNLLRRTTNCTVEVVILWNKISGSVNLILT